MGVTSALRRALRKPIVVSPVHVRNDSLLADRKVLVIGGSSGIGPATAEAARDSVAEVIIASRNPSVELKHAGFELVSWDVGDVRAIESRFRELHAKFGIDSVVNRQGINPAVDFAQDFLAVTPEDFSKVLTVNAASTYFICQAACRVFMEEGCRGHILNIASTEGVRGAVVPYGISKRAIISMTEGIGKLMAPHGITVNGIAPGSTATKMTMGGGAEYLSGDLSFGMSTGRRSVSGEIANMAAFLLSDIGT